MQVYKRSIFGMLKGIIFAPCTAALIYFGLNFFMDDPKIIYGVPSLIFIALIYMAIFSENIRFELDSDGTMRYFKKGKLKHTYILEKCRVSYHSKSDGTGRDITLHIVHIESGLDDSIDCSPLGSRKFNDMYARLKACIKEEPEILKTR